MKRYERKGNFGNVDNWLCNFDRFGGSDVCINRNPLGRSVFVFGACGVYVAELCNRERNDTKGLSGLLSVKDLIRIKHIMDSGRGQKTVEVNGGILENAEEVEKMIRIFKDFDYKLAYKPGASFRTLSFRRTGGFLGVEFLVMGMTEEERTYFEKADEKDHEEVAGEYEYFE